MPKCPHCKTDSSVRPSQKKKQIFGLLRMTGLRAFRCDSCGSRFHRYPDAARQTVPNRDVV